MVPQGYILLCPCVYGFQRYSRLYRAGGDAMVLGKLPVSGCPTLWMIVALAVSAGGGCLDIFTLLYLFSPLCRRRSDMTQRTAKPKTTNQLTTLFLSWSRGLVG